jgi:hypothetical protein
MKKYYLHNGTEQQGPFDIEELKEKNITKTTEIWHEGLVEWIEAGKVEELFDLFKTNTPPPIKSKVETVPPVQKSETANNKTVQQPQKKKSKTGLILISSIGIIVLGIFLFLNTRASTTADGLGSIIGDTYEEKVLTVEEIEKANPTKFLEASGTYNENFWGDKMKIHGIITNNATVANYKDAVIEVIFYSGTDTEIGRKQYVIYNFFNAHTSKNFELKIERPNGATKCGWSAISAVAN